MSRSRVIIFVAVIVAIALLYWWAGGDRSTSSDAPMSMSQMQPTETPQQQSPHDGGQMDTHPLPEIESAVISVQDGNKTDLGTYSIKPGEKVQIEGSDLSISLGEFYNHWSWDSGAMNLSHDIVNPAVKINIYKGNDEIGYGWAFANVEFFTMQSHSGSGGASEQLAFTLRSWEGLTFPSHGNSGE